jgi:hypothetical protein
MMQRTGGEIVDLGLRVADLSMSSETWTLPSPYCDK